MGYRWELPQQAASGILAEKENYSIQQVKHNYVNTDWMWLEVSLTFFAVTIKITIFLGVMPCSQHSLKLEIRGSSKMLVPAYRHLITSHKTTILPQLSPHLTFNLNNPKSVISAPDSSTWNSPRFRVQIHWPPPPQETLKWWGCTHSQPWEPQARHFSVSIKLQQC